MGPGECNSFTLTLLACLMVTPCVPTILTPAVLAFLLLYNLWFEHHSGNSPINQVYTVTHGVGFSEATEEAGLALDSLGDQSSLESARKGARDRTLLMLGLTK